jgi:hypothetical protein
VFTNLQRLKYELIKKGKREKGEKDLPIQVYAQITPTGMLHWQKENKTKEKLQTNNTYTETKENKECKQKKRKSLKTET